MRVLGVDPGTFKMGVGVVDSEDGELTLVHSDVLSPGRSDPLPDRIHYLYEQLSSPDREIGARSWWRWNSPS